MTAKKTVDDERPFERLLDDLDQVVGKLEKGDLGLEESLAAYEQGIGLVRRARARLDAMDKRLEELTEQGQLQPLERNDPNADR